jgi:ketosteroid isomerase-like protein
MLDFEAFKAALEGKDREAWLDFYAEDAEWIEYRGPEPIRRQGREIINAFLVGVCSSPVVLRLSDEVVGWERAAFRVDADLGNGHSIIEHVIVHTDGGLITRQVDVEFWV